MIDRLVDFLLNFYGPWPYAMIFGILIACGLGLPMPEDITLFAAGVMAYYGICELYPMIVICFLGVMIGDGFIFWLGYHYGRRLTRRGFFARILPESRLNEVKVRLDKNGEKLLFFARFMPGLRAPIFFSAGALHYSPLKWFLYDGAAALLSVPAIISLVYYGGDRLDEVVRLIQKVEHGIVVGIIVVVAFVGYRIYRAGKKKNGTTKKETTKHGKSELLKSGVIIFWALTLQQMPALATPTVDFRVQRTAEQEVLDRTKWCRDVDLEIKKLGWKFSACEGVEWKLWDITSVEGRPLVYTEFGTPNSANTTLVMTMVHGDEITPLYVGLKLVGWLKANMGKLQDARIVIVPLVNPDSFLRAKRTRVNARGVDVNRNFPTSDWRSRALQAWRKKFKSAPRRFPGKEPGSEPETVFQQELISRFAPSKILSIHAPLNFMDYDGPTPLSLDKFPKDYVHECLKLRQRLKAVSGGFFPGSLGNYAGRELGIPTLTLELPTADPAQAQKYFERFLTGVRTMIEYRVPDLALREESKSSS